MRWLESNADALMSDFLCLAGGYGVYLLTYYWLAS